MKPPSGHLGRALFLFRARNVLTQGQLAKLLGVSRVTANAWERSSRLPNYNQVQRMLDIGLKPSELFKIKDEK